MNQQHIGSQVPLCALSHRFPGADAVSHDGKRVIASYVPSGRAAPKSSPNHSTPVATTREPMLPPATSESRHSERPNEHAAMLQGMFNEMVEHRIREALRLSEALNDARDRLTDVVRVSHILGEHERQRCLDLIRTFAYTGTVVKTSDAPPAKARPASTPVAAAPKQATAPQVRHPRPRQTGTVRPRNKPTPLSVPGHAVVLTKRLAERNRREEGHDEQKALRRAVTFVLRLVEQDQEDPVLTPERRAEILTEVSALLPRRENTRERVKKHDGQPRRDPNYWAPRTNHELAPKVSEGTNLSAAEQAQRAAAKKAERIKRAEASAKASLYTGKELMENSGARRREGKERQKQRAEKKAKENGKKK